MKRIAVALILIAAMAGAYAMGIYPPMCRINPYLCR